VDGLLYACGGRYRLKDISQLVDLAAWQSFRSLPPKEAIEAFVVTDIVVMVDCMKLRERKERWDGWILVFWIDKRW
jgi:hypothetical protein